MGESFLKKQGEAEYNMSGNNRFNGLSEDEVLIVLGKCFSKPSQEMFFFLKVIKYLDSNHLSVENKEPEAFASCYINSIINGLENWGLHHYGLTQNEAAGFSRYLFRKYYDTAAEYFAKSLYALSATNPSLAIEYIVFFDLKEQYLSIKKERGSLFLKDLGSNLSGLTRKAMILFDDERMASIEIIQILSDKLSIDISHLSYKDQDNKCHHSLELSEAAIALIEEYKEKFSFKLSFVNDCNYCKTKIENIQEEIKKIEKEKNDILDFFKIGFSQLNANYILRK